MPTIIMDFLISAQGTVASLVHHRLWAVNESVASLYYNRLHYHLVSEEDAVDVPTDMEDGSSEKSCVTQTSHWLQWKSWPRERLCRWLAGGLAYILIVATGDWIPLLID